MGWTPAQLAGMAGPGDFDAPERECERLVECARCGHEAHGGNPPCLEIDGVDCVGIPRWCECHDFSEREVCVTHDQPWSLCGGADPEPFDQEPF